jgi:hypothetical protein
MWVMTGNPEARLITEPVTLRIIWPTFLRYLAYRCSLQPEPITRLSPRPLTLLLLVPVRLISRIRSISDQHMLQRPSETKVSAGHSHEAPMPNNSQSQFPIVATAAAALGHALFSADGPLVCSCPPAPPQATGCPSVYGNTLLSFSATKSRTSSRTLLAVRTKVT